MSVCESEYKTQAEMAESNALRARIAASVANVRPEEMNPLGWVYQRSWVFATTPGWCCHYANGTLTDRMILNRVRALFGMPPVEDPQEPSQEVVLANPDLIMDEGGAEASPEEEQDE